MSWTDERVELLKKLWGEGQSASQIAKELGGYPQCQLLAKYIGLGSPIAHPRAQKPKPQKVDKKPEKVTSKKPEAATKEPEPKPVMQSPARRQIIPAGRPLPPQPSANEISPEALARVSEIEKKAKRISLLELTERTCKWPVGDPATPDFWFCGLPTQSGKPIARHMSVWRFNQ